MILTVDIGNTNMEFGVFKDQDLIANFRLNTNRDITSDEIGLMVCQFFAIKGVDRTGIKDVVVSSVVPQVMYSASAAFKKYFGKLPLIAGNDLKIKIPNLYDNPGEVGADRLVNSYASLLLYGAPLVIVDFGTATTFDAVSKDGKYLGGAIYPGIKLSISALVDKASKLPLIELKIPEKAIGTNTAESMQAGTIYGYAGAIRMITEMISREIVSREIVSGEIVSRETEISTENVKIIATGGLSQMIQDATPGLFHEVNKSLTLQGLNRIYRDYINGV
ncbi:MAG: type III pantothenate kinase [Oscillospiraceae bacterium]|nr:type III pantothenate kinase [Oscillospiraceae bacterium]